MTFDSLHAILRDLHTDMMPFCAEMAGVAKGIAGLGALFYIAYRVWKSLANAESIDFFPLLRPLAIGLCIMFFPGVVLGTINAVLSPVVRGTSQMLEKQTFDIAEYRAQKEKLENEAMKRNPETAWLVDKEAFDQRLDELGVLHAPQIAGMYIERGFFNFKRSAQRWFQELLELFFQSASLVIDTIRTFFLVVLAIMGPIAFAISVWDGFQASLTQWFSRYIAVYLWLPVSDLFSSILARLNVLILQHDIERLSDPAFTPDGSNTVYIIFMIIGIVGYFCVPTVAGWIVQAGGMGQFSRNVNRSAARAAGFVGASIGNIAGKLLKKKK